MTLEVLTKQCQARGICLSIAKHQVNRVTSDAEASEVMNTAPTEVQNQQSGNILTRDIPVVELLGVSMKQAMCWK